MLRFIIGTAGTGKTTRLLEEIEQAVHAGEEAILLVPEQLSFESERRLYRSLGPRLSLRVEVLSFTRLCNSIFRALGGLASTPVTPAAKYLLMSIAVDELSDSLAVYRKSLSNVSFLQTLVDTCSEFKMAGVLPGELSAAAQNCDGPLTDKIAELAGIYGTYQALLEQGYTDTDDDLIRACALLENNHFFANRTVFVDGFTTFMAAEFELLGHVVAQSKNCWFALTCDTLQDTQNGMGVFSPVISAAARLQRVAKKNAVPVAEAEVLVCQHRFRDNALGHIGLHFLQPDAAAYSGASDSAVHLRVASDRYQEMEMAAFEIARMVREQGYRYRDIAVVARDTAPYLRALERAFSRSDIPYFADLPRDVENHPLVAGLLHAVDAVRSNLDADAVLLLAKSPLLGLEAESVALLENYCYCWGIRGAAWQQDFVANPRGLAGPLTEGDLGQLARINTVRAALVGPLLALRDALEACTGRRFAAGLYAFLQETGAPEHLTAYAEQLPAEGRTEFLQESAQIWDTLVGILDVFGTVLGNVRIKRTRLCELLRLALGTAEIGMYPQTLDQVLVGKADRIRPVGLRAVFIVGAVEGEFPAQAAASGVFTDTERRQLIEAGVEIGQPTLYRAVLEKFFAYFALTLASEQLFVSYPRADLSGQELLPSVIVSQLGQMFPDLRAEPHANEVLTAGDKAAFELYAREYGQGTVLEATLRDYFVDSGRGEILSLMREAHLRPPHRLTDHALARELFGSRLRLSPTRVERYFRCPFSYFAADGLSVKPRRKVEFTPLESGSVIHNVLQVMVQRYGGRGLVERSEEQLQGEVAQVIQGYLAERVEDTDKLPARFRYLFTRLTGMLARLLLRIGREFDQSEFVPAAFELPIHLQEGIEPLHLETADGMQVLVEGVVDRVDMMQKDGKRYVRVVDYKSGSKNFALEDVLYGLNMQMLLYLFTIQENGTGELADCIPAGVLYMPVRERFVSAARDAEDSKVAAEREKQWRMSGLLLEDEEALRGMERDLKGIFIPAKLGKNGLDARAAIASRAELGKLAAKVKEQVLLMASALGEGKVGAVPTLSDDHDTCAYCDYRAVCGFERGDPVREIAKLDHREIRKLLKEEDDA